MKPLQTGSFFKRHYDELLALIMALGLSAMLLFLGIRMGALQEQTDQFLGEAGRMTPKHLSSKPMDMTAAEDVRRQISSPFQLSGSWTNLLFVPEVRVWCVDCRRPIPFSSDVCPFCDAVQPAQAPTDKDGDTMTDEWEERNKLDPQDPADAALDPDGDGFSNLEEFVAGTDPRDTNSGPPIDSKLFLDRIDEKPFSLLFKSLLKQPDGSYVFGINTRFNRTIFVKLGQRVEGFKVEKFELKLVPDESGATGSKYMNKSILTLSQGDKKIDLIYDSAKQVSTDPVAHLVFRPDGSSYIVKKGGGFVLKDKRYVVLEIDSSLGVVVLKREFDGTRLRISKPTLQSEAR
jgi:hypothetical protein